MGMRYVLMGRSEMEPKHKDASRLTTDKKYPVGDSNARTRLRRPVLYPLS